MSFEGCVAIIGAGSVGGAVAFGLLMRAPVGEILLVDMSQAILEGQVLDLAEASSGTGKVVRAGTFQEAAKADIIVLTADVVQPDNEPRDKWITRCGRLLKSIIDALQPIQPKALVMVVAEPVEFTVRYIQEYTSLDKRQIFGLGTSLANARFRRWLSHLTGAEEADMNAYVVGTGQHPVPAWQAATIQGHSLATIPDLVSQQSAVASVVSSERSNYIRECKGDPWFGIAAALVRLISGIVIQPMVEVLTIHAPAYGSYLALPVVVSIYGGVQKEVAIHLSDEETEALKRAADGVNNEYCL